ncbi:MAG: ABC transporter permease, partial [Pseudobacter sp.]|uniref:ABC transporter permease n=1 Tax=Pseudobacter sp. TaxID=2045420 RepID=UPI003F7E816A
MLNLLFRFELRYHLRQVTFGVSLVLFIVLGFLMSKGNFGGTDLHKNSPYVITYIVSLLSLFSIFLSTVFCAGVVLRDQQWQMDALVFSSGLKRWQWFITRLAGLVLAVFVVLALAMPACWLGWSTLSTDQLGAAAFTDYAWPLLVFGLPDVFFCCCLVFAAAILGRNARSVYATGVLLFILYFTGSILGNSPLMAGSVLKTGEPSLLPYLLDPFGIMSFFGET